MKGRSSINTEEIKALLSRIPAGPVLLRVIHSYRFYRRVGGFKNAKKIFTDIYDRNSWQAGESRSGSGSTLQYTEQIRQHIPELIKALNAHRVLDAPCGDYAWFRYIPRPIDVAYIGGDIVKALVTRNQKEFGNANTSFVELDITRDSIPCADLWLCRDALFHFSYRDIFRTFRNFLRSDIKYFLTSSHPECSKNTNVPSGSFRLLNLELPPFNFGPPIAAIDDWIEGYPVRKLCLWRKDQVRDFVASNKALSWLR